MTKLLFVALSFLLTATTSYALPLPTPEQQVLARSISHAQYLQLSSDYDFEGIVALSNCSGSLVRYETSHDDDYALILTNGHCLDLGGFLKPGEIVYNQQMSRRFSLYDRHINNVATLHSTHIAYGTMTGTDLAIYRLNKTFAEIKRDHNIDALVLSSEPAQVDDGIQVLSGYWKRGYSCAVEYFVDKLEEAGWMWTDSIRYLQPGCETIGGTSGSPIISTRTGKVVGVNNTGNESGRLCTMNNPCEVDADGNKKAYRGASYGQQTFWIYSCLTENNEINLLKEGCLLHH